MKQMCKTCMNWSKDFEFNEDDGVCLKRAEHGGLTKGDFICDEYINKFKPLTKVKKEILKDMGSIGGCEGFSKLLYDTNLKIMSRSLERFKEKVELTDEEIELLVLYNEFCSKFE